MTDAGIAELWSDADYYASEMSSGDYRALGASAKATLRAIRAQYPASTDWWLDPRIVL
jgi:hypothetical protein